ncbi:hypothetical protein [Ruminiclostridium cellobioparum]|uniref:hypothetical protein n=1 Tax=Ruminiclostridium cellobioparum TaxID=29355 RepID=UPI0028B04258|nr:hypothetical protein [Ruminiclostridium cellobioparum]
MYTVLIIILIATVFIFIYNLLTVVLNIPSTKSKKVLDKIKIGSQKEKKKIYEGLMRPIIKCISKLVKISEFKKNKYNIGLKKIGKNVTPEEFVAEALTKSILTALCAVFFILIKFPVPSIGCIFLSVLMYFNEIRKLDLYLKRNSEQILKELPRFIRTFSHSLKGTDDIIKIFETYRKVAGKAFQYDLDVLITDLKIGNHEEALRKFDDRLNIPQLSTFLSGVIGTSKGIDQNTFFVFMEENMKALARENLRRELQKRPGKFSKATWTVAACGIFMYVVPVASSVINGLQVLK